jgi:ribonucleoside-diphosphate reductase alpha chain
VGFGQQQVKSLPDAVGQALLKHLQRDITPPAPPSAEYAPAVEVPRAPAPSVAEPLLSNGNGNGHAITSPNISAQKLLEKTVQLTGNLCPGCGCNSLVYQEGCRKCNTCGHSEC